MKIDDINSSPSSAAYTRQRIGWALFQIMACRLFDAKALPKPMMTYCQLDLKEQTSVKCEPKYEIFHESAFEKIVWEMEAILSRGDELTFSLKDVTYRCLSWLLLELDAHIAPVIFIV